MMLARTLIFGRNYFSKEKEMCLSQVGVGSRDGLGPWWTRCMVWHGLPRKRPHGHMTGLERLRWLTGGSHVARDGGDTWDGGDAQGPRVADKRLHDGGRRGVEMREEDTGSVFTSLASLEEDGGRRRPAARKKRRRYRVHDGIATTIR